MLFAKTVPLFKYWPGARLLESLFRPLVNRLRTGVHGNPIHGFQERNRSTRIVIHSRMMDESPKWLLSAGKYDELKVLLKKIVKRNKIDRDGEVDIDAIVEEAKASFMLVRISRC